MDRAIKAAYREELRRTGLPGQGALARLLALLRTAPETHLGRGEVVRMAAESACFRGASGSDVGATRHAEADQACGRPAEAKSAEYFLWCGELPGFGLRVFPSGKKSYLVQYRAGGRSRRARIGMHGPVTCAGARKEAMALLGQVARGGDPAEERATTERHPLRAKPGKHWKT